MANRHLEAALDRKSATKYGHYSCIMRVSVWFQKASIAMKRVSAHSGHHHSRLIYLSLRAFGCKQVICRPCSLHSQRMTTPPAPQSCTRSRQRVSTYSHCRTRNACYRSSLDNRRLCLSHAPTIRLFDMVACVKSPAWLAIHLCASVSSRQTSLISACKAAHEGAHQA